MSFFLILHLLFERRHFLDPLANLFLVAVRLVGNLVQLGFELFQIFTLGFFRRVLLVFLALEILHLLIEFFGVGWRCNQLCLGQTGFALGRLIEDANEPQNQHRGRHQSRPPRQVQRKLRLNVEIRKLLVHIGQEGLAGRAAGLIRGKRERGGLRSQRSFLARRSTRRHRRCWAPASNRSRHRAAYPRRKVQPRFANAMQLWWIPRSTAPVGTSPLPGG